MSAYFDFVDKIDVFGENDTEVQASIIFVDNTTDVREIENRQLKMNNVFDLSGRRVTKPQKGLFIVNGKKIVK